MSPRSRHSMDEQFPLAPLAQHHDLDTWHRRSEEALVRHWSDLGHVDAMRTIMGMEPLQRTPRQASTPMPDATPGYEGGQMTPMGDAPQAGAPASPTPSVQYTWPDGSVHLTPPPRPVRPSIAYEHDDEPPVGPPQDEGSPAFVPPGRSRLPK